MSDCTYFDKDTTVHGELSTGDLVVEGVFEGHIEAGNKVLLKKTARITANIKAQKLMIEEGAVFDGRIRLQNGHADGT